MSDNPPILWLLTDNKPGHRNQLRGLAGRLRALTGARPYWLSASEYSVSGWRALLGAAPRLPGELPAPNVILGAGSGSHRLLLALRRKAPTVVLMKPSFPRRWVSAVILPEHDGINEDRRTLTTRGPINTITPLARVTEKPQGLILVGGPSKHCDWDEVALLTQIRSLITDYPGWSWTLSGSRRTPPTMQSALAKLQGPRVTAQDPSRTHEDWLAHQLAASRAVFVSPDSAAMVWEAITSGVPTGLLELPARGKSRVTRGIEQAIAAGLATPWLQRAELMNSTRTSRPALWEADRAARWLQHTLPHALPQRGQSQ